VAPRIRAVGRSDLGIDAIGHARRNHAMRKAAALLVLAGALAACSPTQERYQSERYQIDEERYRGERNRIHQECIEEVSRITASLAPRIRECYAREREVAIKHGKLDPYDELFWAYAAAMAERFDHGQILEDEMNFYVTRFGQYLQDKRLYGLGDGPPDRVATMNQILRDFQSLGPAIVRCYAHSSGQGPRVQCD
jgi:hypothetical protein